MKLKGILAGLGAASIWGGMYVASKYVLDVIPPFILLSLRLILAIIAVGLILLWQRWKGFSRKEFLIVLGIGLIGFGISIGLQLFGTRLSTAANGAVITSSTPAFIFLFAILILKEKITRRRIFALLVSSIGVVVVVDLSAAKLSSDLFLGNIALVFAALTWALYSVLIRKVTQELDTLPVSFVAFLGGLIISLPLGAWELQHEIIGEITWGVIAGILYLSIISTALAAYLWNKAFEILDAGVASFTLFAQPVVGTILSVLLLSEKLTPSFIIGGGLIIFGLLLAAKDK